MTHERHADFLQDAGLHQARVKGVAEIVKTDVADGGILQSRFPRALYYAYGLAAELDDKPLVFAALDQMIVQPLG